MPFPPNKTFKELGLDPKATFIVVDEEDHCFKKGDLVTYVGPCDFDECSAEFKKSNDQEQILGLDQVEYATPPLKTFETLEAGDKLKYKNEEDEDLIVVDFSVLRQVFFLRGAITGQVDLWGQENMKRDLDIIQPPSPEQPVEMTLEEIEKALGKKIKIVESK